MELEPGAPTASTTPGKIYIRFFGSEKNYPGPKGDGRQGKNELVLPESSTANACPNLATPVEEGGTIF